MDYFDQETVLSIINSNKKPIIEELDSITFSIEQLGTESDKLLQVLEYTPKIKDIQIDKLKFLPPIKLKVYPEINTSSPSPKKPKGGSIQQIKLNVNTPVITDQDKIEICKSILNEILDKILGKENNDSEEESNEDDESDDEYEKLMAQRAKQMEEREKQNENDSDDDDKKRIMKKSEDLKENKKKVVNDKNQHGISFKSRLSSAMNLLTTIKIYLMDTKQYIDLEVSPSDNVKAVKAQIIQTLLTKKIMNLKFKSPNAYELRIIEKGEFKANMDIPALDNNQIICMLKVKNLAFLYNPKYDPKDDEVSVNILGVARNNTISELNKISDPNSINSNSQKINIKVYFKSNGINQTKVMSLSGDDNLKQILNNLFNQDLLKYKNIDLYYFVEHKSSEDPDNAINLEQNIKYLQEPYELTLCYKNFPDLQDAKNIYNPSGMLPNRNRTKTTTEQQIKDEDSNSGREYFFNEISAGLYQEFEVIKINKYKQKQERILGIDMYKLYNNLPKKKSGIFKKIFNETKNPIRKIKNVTKCKVTGDKAFYMEIKEDDRVEPKKFYYEVKNNNIRDEIVAKLNFLIKLNQDNN